MAETFAAHGCPLAIVAQGEHGAVVGSGGRVAGTGLEADIGLLVYGVNLEHGVAVGGDACHLGSLNPAERSLGDGDLAAAAHAATGQDVVDGLAEVVSGGLAYLLGATHLDGGALAGGEACHEVVLLYRGRQRHAYGLCGGATCLVGSELYHIVGAKHTGIVGLVETEAEHRGGVDIIIYIIVAVCTGGGDKHHHQQRYDIS